LSSSQSENDFWRFSLRVYRAPGVADECIAVQDRYAVDVNVMLFCAWVGAERGRAMTQDELASCRAAVGEWHESTVKPLRAARQTMKGLPGVEPLRTQVKGLELEAERIEQTMLFELARLNWPATGDMDSADAARANVELFLRAHSARGLEVVPALMAAVEKEASRSAGAR
jgi:uncharacterized protein (TIGR02444 family)